MEQEIHITLRFNLATGKVNLNEIVYKLKELQNPIMLKILEQILRGYDDLILERLSRTDLYPSKARKGLGRHVKKGDPEERFCRGILPFWFAMLICIILIVIFPQIAIYLPLTMTN